jgi:L-2,4-diaminobutyrate decarboxylase
MTEPNGPAVDPFLVDYRDEARARPELERIGAAAWATALDWLYGQAFDLPTRPTSYKESRAHAFPVDGTPLPAPTSGQPWADVLDEFRTRVAGDAFSAYQPRTFSYFTPPPLVMAIVGDMLARWLNQGVDIWHAAPSATLVEEEVVAWLCALAGFPDDSFGVLTSGGAMANLMAMAVARDAHLARLTSTASPPRAGDLCGTRVYGGEQAHFSIARAIDVLGFPAGTLNVVPSDATFHLRPEPLAAAIEQDLAAGLRPFAVVATAGTTNTGAVDPLPELADVAQAYGLWLHVDAAYGGAVRLSSRDADRVTGLDRADSVTLDPHKWFFQPHDIGGLLVRRRSDLLNTFHRSPEYLRSLHEEPLDWYQHSIEGTRPLRALKLWMSWKHLGSEGLGRLIEHTNDLAAYLAERCELDPRFDVAGRPELSVVCFRVLPNGTSRLSEEELDAHQDRIQQALEASGQGWLSTTKLRGRTYLRAGVMNYMSTPADVDQLLATLRDL